ncbi:protease HtpX [Desulfonatronovibrio magnus]|uniref:protease HtpX n=1 Tax=Desulfonatronovibrio magnus TaxID=698827 RepID=UPI0005EB1D5C|nr:protease HtpX [Desulfonatronovibrio magnus]
MKRVFLFLATNIAILAVLFVVLNLLGVTGILDEQRVGIDYSSLLIFAAVLGFGGSFISLAISKWMAKRLTGTRVITQPANELENWLIRTVRQQAQRANIGMPEVGIFDSEVPNAFATGMSKNKALVAVSTGLLRTMNQDEVEAVLAHEVSHVANGDMITLTLIQGVVNTFVIFISRIVGHFVDRVIFKNEEGHGIGFFVASLVSQIVFGILASTIVLWFSRQREFRADAGGARLAGTEKMVSALEKLKKAIHEPLPDQMSSFGINGKSEGYDWKALFMSHPPLDKRIAALKGQLHR